MKIRGQSILGIVLAIGILAIIAGSIWLSSNSTQPSINNNLNEKIVDFQTCLEYGGLASSFPVGCKAPDGRIFPQKNFENILPDPCAAVLCPANTFCQNGICYPNQTNPLPDTCQQIKCQTGYFCENGVCVPGTKSVEPKENYICTTPCSGMTPSPEVSEACASFKTQSECSAYKNSQFPYECVWQVANYTCPPLP